ncbi:MAG: inositol monophosphatase [Nitriliruptorales bacterium]|nr:inositol monophosphatase [Nitriliruptorales bacterium]
MRTDAELDDLLQLATAIAGASGALLREHFGAVHRVETKSSATDPVSEADRASESLLVASLRDTRPRDGLLGEEGADREGSSGLRWVLDPLDGTVNYLYGLPTWTVSVACEASGGDDWAAVVGVVHDPLRHETFRACRGRGAWIGDRPLKVNDPVPLERALVSTGFAYSPEVRADQAAVLADLLPRIRDIRRGGSAALDLCYVAAGRYDGYYETSTSRWDWAAGSLIAAEAGAVVTHVPVPGGGSGLIASGPALHDPLLRAVAS